MMGDLNVAPLTTGAAEWAGLFANPGSFFTRPLYDAWARTTSPDDRGVTNQNDHERLDYILSFPEPYTAGDLEGPLCIQHVTIPTDFQDLQSDHYLVHADTNIGTFHCSPQIAYRVNLEPSPNPGMPPQEFTFVDDEAGTDVTQIKRPGQMQWFHVRKGEAGTYLIALTSNEVRMDVFAPDDLTTPISRYNKTTVPIVLADRSLFVDTYVLPREFYIRVAGIDRATTADLKHGCAALAAKILGSQFGSGMVGAEKGTASRERRSDRSALDEGGPTEGDADRHKLRVERDDRAGADPEQQRVHPVNGLELLSVPAQRFQDAIQRMCRRQSGATPSPDHELRLQARQGVEAGESVGVSCRTGQPVLGPSGSRDGWCGQNHPAFTMSASGNAHAVSAPATHRALTIASGRRRS
jgi:hypothetical protein